MPKSKSAPPSRGRVTPRGWSDEPAVRRRPRRLRRFGVILAVSSVAIALALLTVTNVGVRERRADLKNEAASPSTTTTTMGIPSGGIGCPRSDGGSRKQMVFPAAGPPDCLNPESHYEARLTTDLGVITMTLFPDRAPKSVNSFVVLARYHFYDQLTFHKLVPNFYAQSGDPGGEGVTDPGYLFDDKLPAAGEYKAGSVVIANEGPGKNGSQFLILVDDKVRALQPQYPLFGTVTSGLDVARKLAADGDAGSGEPLHTHFLLKVTIIET